MTPDEAKQKAQEWQFEAGGELLPDITSNELAGIVNEAISEAISKERDAHNCTKGMLVGAINAIKELRECVPPKYWKRYASYVIALHERLNTK